MPTDTPDQQITLPVGADAANNPTAFTNFVADVEQRLIRLYTNEADRLARMLTLAENQISGLATENRLEVYNGTNHISLYSRSLYADLYKSADQTLTASSTALQNVTELVQAMPTAGTFSFRGLIYCDSSATADIKFAFTFPAGASVRWNIMGPPTAGGSTGDGTYTVTTVSDTSVSYGMAGAATILALQLEGDYVAGGTAGNLQLRAAQNAGEASNTIVRAQSRMEIWRRL